MNRIIKFRRYFENFETKEVIFREWGCIDHHGNAVFDNSHFVSPSFVSGYRAIGDCQFTGLHDKEGKEIYERYILTSKTGRHEVYWKSSAASFACRRLDDTRGIYHLNKKRAQESEVIGNIYQNPDLLTK